MLTKKHMIEIAQIVREVSTRSPGRQVRPATIHRCGLWRGTAPERKTTMKTLILVATITLAALLVPAMADDNHTPVSQCDHLPADAQISVLSTTATRGVCEAMLRILDGVTIADVRYFSEAAALLSFKSAGSLGEPADVAAQLVEIIRLRGLARNEPQWEPTVELVWKLWNGEHGLVTPHTIIETSTSAGPKAAAALSDDGLIGIMVAAAVLHKRGGGPLE